jgi:hypothetical protein
MQAGQGMNGEDELAFGQFRRHVHLQLNSQLTAIKSPQSGQTNDSLPKEATFSGTIR